MTATRAWSKCLSARRKTAGASGEPLSLRQIIVEEIRDGGIPARHMELCPTILGLDTDDSRNAERFGKAGDFYTSSDVHAVFDVCWHGSLKRSGV
jgi:hypothetical protein